MKEEIGAQICEALGLDPTKIIQVTISIKAGRPANVFVREIILDNADASDICEQLKKYKLVED